MRHLLSVLRSEAGNMRLFPSHLLSVLLKTGGTCKRPWRASPPPGRLRFFSGLGGCDRWFLLGHGVEVHLNQKGSLSHQSMILGVTDTISRLYPN